MSANFKEKTFLPPRILLVDDDDVLRNEFVECFGEFGIAEAANGQEALAYLKKPNEIDLAILDVRMSGMNGIELLERIKRVAPAVRVIIFTGYGSKDVAIEALRSKADDYIEKPPGYRLHSGNDRKTPPGEKNAAVRSGDQGQDRARQGFPFAQPP